MNFHLVTASLCALVLVAVVSTAQANSMQVESYPQVEETMDAMMVRTGCKNLWCGKPESPQAKDKFAGYGNKACSSSIGMFEGSCSTGKNIARCRDSRSRNGTCNRVESQGTVQCEISSGVICTREVCYCK